MNPEFLTSLLSAFGAIGGGASGRRKSQETAIQKQQRNIIDQILAGLGGEGQFADLFNADEGAFQRSYVDPSLRRFEKFIAPQIQQSYIQSGQQRGTGLQDTLTRAGVDLQSNLDEKYAGFQQDAMERQLRALSGVLGMDAGAPRDQSRSEAFGEAIAGYTAQPGFRDDVSNIFETLGFGKSNRRGFSQ